MMVIGAKYNRGYVLVCFVPYPVYKQRLKCTFIIFFCLPLMFFELLTPLDKIEPKVKPPLIEPPFVPYIYTWHQQVFAT